MTWYRYGRHHEATIDPMDLLEVDPLSIENKISGAKQDFNESDFISEVIGGNWDQKTRPLDEYDLHRAIVRRIREEIPWGCTAFYARVKNNFETRDYEKWGCSTMEDFRHRLGELDRLRESIERDGYRTQRELRKMNGSVPADRSIHRYWPPELHEVTVDVARDGELLFHESRHRFAVAQALEVDRIPVRVKARHSLWQERRNAFARGEQIDDELVDHPDLPR